MPDESEPKPAIDLSDLRLMPKWVADFSKAAPSKYADMPEEDSRERRGPRDGGRGRREGGGGGFRGERRDGGGSGGGGGFRGERRDGPPRGDRKPFDKPFGRRDERGGGPRGDRRDRGGFRGRDDRDRDRGPRFEPPPTVPGLTTFIEPEKKSTEALATTIRAAGKAFSVFDAARLVLQSGDRFHVKFSVPADSAVKLCTIPADGSVWLGREEAVAHFLHSDGLKEFYRVEEIELEEPKGVFNSIAVCGLTGEILGPASHHSYQTSLHRIHRERFSDMRFEDYKRRVRTDNSPEIIEKWKDSQKRGQVWIYLTPSLEEGAEPVKFKSRSEMEAHFRKTHAETLVHETNDAWVAGNIPKQHLSPSLYHALRRGVDDARKHLLPVAQILCSGFESHGLKLFKRRGGKLWVSRTRPKALDSSVVLSTRIAKMVEIIKAKPGISVKELVEIVSPSADAPKAAAPAPASTTETPVAEAATESTVAETPPSPASEAPAAVPAAAAHHEWTSDQLHALQDLHWLNSEGYVIEYSDGIVFIGVTEPPPPKPKAPKQAAESPAPVAAETSAPESSEQVAEDVTAEVVEARAPEAQAPDEPEHSEPDEPAVTAQAPVAEVAESVSPEPPATHADEPEPTEDEPTLAPFSFMDDPVPAGEEEKAPGR
jgi:hypothetical protein